MNRTTYRIDWVFGPAGSFAGIVVFLAGIFGMIFSWSGLILMGIGGFTGFSFSATRLDLTNRRVRFAHMLFGIFPYGRWLTIEPDMYLGMVRQTKVWRTYSRSNRSTDVTRNRIQIILCDSSGRSLLPIRNCSSREEAERILTHLSIQLGISSRP